LQNIFTFEIGNPEHVSELTFPKHISKKISQNRFLEKKHVLKKPIRKHVPKKLIQKHVPNFYFFKKNSKIDFLKYLKPAFRNKIKNLDIVEPLSTLLQYHHTQNPLQTAKNAPKTATSHLYTQLHIKIQTI